MLEKLDKFLKVFEWKKALKLIITINLFALILCGVTNYKIAGYFIANEPEVLKDVMVCYELLIAFQILLMLSFYFGTNKKYSIEKRRVALSILCFTFILMMIMPGRVKLEYNNFTGEYKKSFVNMYGVYLYDYIPFSEVEKTLIKDFKQEIRNDFGQ